MRTAETMPAATIVGLALALGACGRGSHDGASAQDTRERRAIRVRTTPAVARRVPVTLMLDGTLLADEESHVTSVVGGRVTAVLVERGASVRQGAPLVRLRDVDYRLAASAARASLDQAQARLGIQAGQRPPPPDQTAEVRTAQSEMELAESNLRRVEELARHGALAAQQLEEARARAAAARERHQMSLQGARASIAALSASQVQLRQASTAASEATVRAPFSGEIAERSVSVGEFVAPQTPLVTLVRVDPLRMELTVPQQYLLAVRAGQRVVIRLDAVPNRTFEGTVRYVSAAVQRSTRGLTVEAVLANSDGVLRPGLFATARIETGTTRDAAVVPQGAVLEQAGVHRVFVSSGGTLQERVVSIMDRNDNEVVIDTGVRAGERVVVSGIDRLADGLRVVEGS